jgi:hypothetical protein
MFISKKAVIAGVSTLVLVGGGAALALFTTQATTTETVRVAEVADDDLTLDADLSSLVLYPGVTRNDIVIKARNDNPDVSFEIESFRPINNAQIEVVDAAGACAKDNFTIVASEGGYDGAVVRPYVGATDVGLLSIAMDEEAGNGCQGASLEITIRANAVNATS